LRGNGGANEGTIIAAGHEVYGNDQSRGVHSPIVYLWSPWPVFPSSSEACHCDRSGLYVRYGMEGIADGVRWHHGEGRGTILTLCTCFGQDEPGLDSTATMHHSTCQHVASRGMAENAWCLCGVLEPSCVRGDETFGRRTGKNSLASPRLASHRYRFSFDEHRKGRPRRLDVLWQSRRTLSGKIHMSMRHA
jgi:hypothetical protein